MTEMGQDAAGATDKEVSGATEVGGVVGAGEMAGDDSGRSEAEINAAGPEEGEEGEGVIGAAEVGGLAD